MYSNKACAISSRFGPPSRRLAAVLFAPRVHFLNAVSNGIPSLSFTGSASFGASPCFVGGL